MPFDPAASAFNKQKTQNQKKNFKSARKAGYVPGTTTRDDAGNILSGTKRPVKPAPAPPVKPGNPDKPVGGGGVSTMPTPAPGGPLVQPGNKPVIKPGGGLRVSPDTPPSGPIRAPQPMPRNPGIEARPPQQDLAQKGVFQDAMITPNGPVGRGPDNKFPGVGFGGPGGGLQPGQPPDPSRFFTRGSFAPNPNNPYDLTGPMRGPITPPGGMPVGGGPGQFAIGGNFPAGNGGPSMGGGAMGPTAVPRLPIPYGDPNQQLPTGPITQLPGGGIRTQSFGHAGEPSQFIGGGDRSNGMGFGGPGGGLQPAAPGSMPPASPMGQTQNPFMGPGGTNPTFGFPATPKWAQAQGLDQNQMMQYAQQNPNSPYAKQLSDFFTRSMGGFR